VSVLSAATTLLLSSSNDGELLPVGDGDGDAEGSIVVVRKNGKAFCVTVNGPNYKQT
jgi:hypothetical protein